MKRTISLLVIIVVMISLTFTGCGNANPPAKDTTGVATTGTAASSVAENLDPFGKYEPAIDLTAVNTLINADSVAFIEGESPSNNIWIKTYEEQLGIKVNVLWGDSNPEKTTLMIASGDLPDIFCLPGDGAQYNQLVEQGLLADLTDVYEKYASPLVKDFNSRDGGVTMEATKRNGKLYAIPRWSDPIDESTMLWVREDWRAKLNLPKPKTVDDMITIAKAFVTQDPDGNGKADTVGLYIGGDGTTPDGYRWNIDPVFYSFNAYPYVWVKDASGKLVYGKAQAPEMKAAMSFLQKMYKDGLIAKDFAANTGANFADETVQGKYGMMYGPYYSPLWPFDGAKQAHPESDWIAYENPQGTDKPAMMPVSGISVNQYYVVNKNCKNPEAAIKMLNLADKLMWGPESQPDVYANDPKDGRAIFKYAVVTQLLPRGEDNKYIDIKKAIDTGDESSIIPNDKAAYTGIKDFMSTGNIANWKYYRTYGPDESGIKIQLDYEKNEKILRNAFYGTLTPAMTTNMDTLNIKFNDELVKIIMGTDVNDYDRFLQEWNQLGGEQMTKEANDWYSALNK